MNFALLFALLVAIVAVVLAFQNPQEMSVQFLGYESRNASTALILLITYALGLITGILTTIPGRLRAQAEARRARREADEERTRAVGVLNHARPVGDTPVVTTTTTPAPTTATPDPYTSRFGEPPNRV